MNFFPEFTKNFIFIIVALMMYGANACLGLEVSSNHGGKAKSSNAHITTGSDTVKLSADPEDGWKFVKGATEASGGQVLATDKSSAIIADDDAYSLSMHGKARPTTSGGPGSLANWSAYTSDNMKYHILPREGKIVAGGGMRFVSYNESGYAESLWRWKDTAWHVVTPSDEPETVFYFSNDDPGHYVVKSKEYEKNKTSESEVTVIGVKSITAEYKEGSVTKKSAASNYVSEIVSTMPVFFVPAGSKVQFKANIEPVSEAGSSENGSRDKWIYWSLHFSAVNIEESSNARLIIDRVQITHLNAEKAVIWDGDDFYCNNIPAGLFVVKAQCGTSIKYIKITSVSINLTADLNFNSSPNNSSDQDKDEYEEEERGLVLLNGPHGSNDYPHPSEPIILSHCSALVWPYWSPLELDNTKIVMQLSSSGAGLWVKKDGLWKYKYNGRYEWDCDEDPGEIRLEGIENGEGFITMTLYYNNVATNYSDKVSIAVWDIKVEWKAINSASSKTIMDNNPNIGGGFRVFPGKLDPDDNIDHQHIQVIARAVPGAVDENGDPLKFYFTAIDVDDPSASDNAVDNDYNSDGSRKITPDNRAVTQSGLSNYFAEIDGNGEAVVDMTFSLGPGDNYRVAAISSIDAGSVWFRALQGVTDGRVVWGNSNGTVYKNFVTPLLTVWRKLHVEVDSMSAVTGNSLTGTILAVDEPDPIGNAYQQITITAVDETIWTDNEDGRFQSGVITIVVNGVDTKLGVRKYDARNMTDDGIDTEILRVKPNPGLAVGQVFVLEDDDGAVIGGFPPVVLPRRPDTGLMKKYFNKAYVEPILTPYETAPFYDTNVPFALNVELTEATSELYTLSQKDLTSSQNFWTVKVISAFQEELSGDYDNEDLAVLGIVYDPGWMRGREHGALIFLETIRDNATVLIVDAKVLEQQTVVHEVGHEFHLLHSHGKNGTLQDPTDDYIMTDKFSEILGGVAPNKAFLPESINIIRALDYPHR